MMINTQSSTDNLRMCLLACVGSSWLQWDAGPGGAPPRAHCEVPGCETAGTISQTQDKGSHYTSSTCSAVLLYNMWQCCSGVQCPIALLLPTLLPPILFPPTLLPPILPTLSYPLLFSLLSLSLSLSLSTSNLPSYLMLSSSPPHCWED